MQDKIINSYGEILSKEDLIQEIESLINRLSIHNQTTTFDKHMMESLEISDLNSIRNDLLKKCGQEVENNIEWLYSLDKNEKS